MKADKLSCLEHNHHYHIQIDDEKEINKENIAKQNKHEQKIVDWMKIKERETQKKSTVSNLSEVQIACMCITFFCCNNVSGAGCSSCLDFQKSWSINFE